MPEELNRYFASVFIVEDTNSIPELRESGDRETIIKDETVEYLKVRCKIGLSQHRFVMRKSCLTNLFEFFEKVMSKLDKRKAADMIYLDFQKAFDKVPHRRLLNK
eukprot:g26318.t1